MDKLRGSKSSTVSAFSFLCRTAATKTLMTSSMGVTPHQYDYDDVTPCSDDDEDCDVSSGVNESSEFVDKSDVAPEVNSRRVPVGRHPDDIDIDSHNHFRTISYNEVQWTTPALVTPTFGWVRSSSLQPEVEVNREENDGAGQDDIDEQLDEVLITDEQLSHPGVRPQQPPSASTGGGVPSTQQFGTNLALIVGIAAGIVVLMAILVYAVCRLDDKYRGNR